MAAKQHRALKRIEEVPYLWRDSNNPTKYVVRFAKRGERRLFATFQAKTPRQAKRLAQEKIKEYLGTHVPVEKITFGAVAKEIIEVKKRGRAFKTYESIESHMRLHLLPHFADMIVQKITDLSWYKYVEKQRERNVKRKLGHDRRYFLEVMGRAFNEGWIKRKITLPKIDRSEGIGKEFSDNEITRMLTNADDDLRLFIFIGVTMGLRPGETMGLRWTDIDFKANEIIIQWFREKRRKSRVVEMNRSHVVSILRRRSLEKSSPFVFPAPKDLTTPQKRIKRKWGTCLKRANVKGRPNDLRHTCATRLLRAGMSVDDVADYLGHSREMLVKIYKHMSKQDRVRLADAVVLPTIGAPVCKAKKGARKVLKMRDIDE